MIVKEVCAQALQLGICQFPQHENCRTAGSHKQAPTSELADTCHAIQFPHCFAGGLFFEKRGFRNTVAASVDPEAAFKRTVAMRMLVRKAA